MTSMPLDPQACYRALRARDARFDGRFFIGVKTTGIYCRPVCPAGRARFENCRFFITAAAAQSDGFRPCLRCRPETVAQLGAWKGTSNTVTRALRLLAEERADVGHEGLDALAERVGVSDRHLRRLFAEHVGATPVAVLQTQRVLFAKQLLHETQLPITEVALASGFGSVRRFNHVFRSLFGRPPSALRRELDPAPLDTGLTVRLRYRAPYAWEPMLWYLRSRAIEGLEVVTPDSYRRALRHEGRRVEVLVRNDPGTSSLVVTLQGAEVTTLSALIARVRSVFDVDADVSLIAEQLSKDTRLAPMIRRHPGLRVPGAWSGFESAVRTVLGQQVTVEAGRRLTATLVAACGGKHFPEPNEVLRAPLERLKMPQSRRDALRSLAKAARSDARVFDARATLDETLARLEAIPGIGPWTASVIALRAAREPDAFPVGDVGLLRAFPRGAQEQRKLLARAEAWRPWRGYAAQHLWAAEMPSESHPQRTEERGTAHGT